MEEEFNKAIILITSSNPSLCNTLDINCLVDYSFELVDKEGIASKFKERKLV